MFFKRKTPTFLLRDKAEIGEKDVLSLSGEKLGYVQLTTYSNGKTGWHSVFRVGPSSNGLHLAQGHGKTPEEAVHAAVKGAWEGIKESAADLIRLEGMLNGQV